jgi:hypothetical protein
MNRHCVVVFVFGSFVWGFLIVAVFGNAGVVRRESVVGRA